MKKFLFNVFFLAALSSNAQESLENLLKLHNDKGVPYISVQELAMPKTNAIILDAREKEEYEVSHINNALFVGYNKFKTDSVSSTILDKDSLIVVYCSLGIRSEIVADKLIKAGYTNVFNLYGGIFEWKNNGSSVYDNENNETDKIHAFSRMWGKWLVKGIKVYE